MSGQDCNPVQEKIKCVYVIGVTGESSSKRPQQNFKVSATEDVNIKALSDDIISARATEKLDGTCCLVDIFNDQPWLWARHDRKPSKAGEKRFAQYKKSLAKNEEHGHEEKKTFSWSAKDFKEVPEDWIPALRLEIKDGFVMPDDIGHTPGWVPVDVQSRQHCWHLSAVDLSQGVALVLRQNNEFPDELEIIMEPLSCLCGQTCELIGTNINGNPYGLGSKKCPFHVLVPHGSISTECPTVTSYDCMYQWFTSDESASQVEGVVWHCHNKNLYKLHRHHLNLKWPVGDPYLSKRKVTVKLDLSLCETNSSTPEKCPNIFERMASLNNHQFDDLHKLCDSLNSEMKGDS